jgi:maltooligosyltrehalose synthase
VWGEARLRLPPDLASRRWRSALTGETLVGATALPLARVLDPAPVALLLSGVRARRRP